MCVCVRVCVHTGTICETICAKKCNICIYTYTHAYQQTNHSVLQYVAVFYSALQCVAVCFSVTSIVAHTHMRMHTSKQTKQINKLTYIRTSVHALVQTLAHTSNTPLLVFIHTYIHACTQTYIHTYMHARKHTYIHTCMHANIHTCKQTYTHIHTQRQQCPLRPPPAFFQGFFLTLPTKTLPDFCLHTCIHSCTYMLRVRQGARERETETVTHREGVCVKEREQKIFFQWWDSQVDICS